MKRLCVWVVRTMGAAEVLLRSRSLGLIWTLTKPPQHRRAFLVELQWLEADPAFLAEWRAAVDDQWEQCRIDPALGELVRLLSREDGPV